MKKCWTLVISLILTAGSMRAADTNSTNQHTTTLGESVLRLLESQDVAGFANDLALTNQYDRRQVSESARLVLDQAARMAIRPSRVHFRIKEVLARPTGTGQ